MSKVWRKLKTKQAHKKTDPQLQKARGKQVGKIPATCVKKSTKSTQRIQKIQEFLLKIPKSSEKSLKPPKNPFSIENP